VSQDRFMSRPSRTMASDPRHTSSPPRNTDRQFGDGIELDADGRASVKLDPAGSQYINARGEIADRLGDGLETVTGSPRRKQLAVGDDSLQFKDGRAIARPKASQVRNDSSVTGGSVKDVLDAHATAIAARIETATRAAANGVAPLDANAQVPVANMPWVMGTATLVAGTVTVASAAVTASSRVFHARQTAGGTLGHLSIANLVVGVSFDILSSDVADTSTVAFLLIG